MTPEDYPQRGSMTERVKAGLDRDMQRLNGSALSYEEIAAIYGDQDEHTGQETSAEEAGESEAVECEPSRSRQEAQDAGQGSESGNVQQEDGCKAQ